jgi:hypothetical protein
MNREEFNTYWKNKGYEPSDIDYKAYRLGQQMNENTVQGQQNKIANQIRKAGQNPDPVISKSKAETVDHHPSHPYMSWAEYRGNRASMGYAVNKKDYDHYLRSEGITTQGDHDISRQNIHKNQQGTGSISKGEPDHVHDQKQGASTSKGIPKPPPSDKPKPAPPQGTSPASADTPPLPTQRTQPYTYPYKNLPFDPTRQPAEIGDPFYSSEYQDQLTRWSRKNWDLYQRKQPLIPKPLPPKPTMIKERQFLTSKTKTYDEIVKDTLKNTRFVPAKDVKISVYTKQKPYYMEIKGVRQPGLFNIKGEKFDETGPKITDLGLLNQDEGFTGGLDRPDKIREQAWNRGFDVLGAAGAFGAASARSTVIGAEWAQRVSQTSQRAFARNAARLRNLARMNRYGNMSTRGIGSRAPVSRGGLVYRGPASRGGAEALQNAGL